MDQATVLDYENLYAEDLLYWQKRAFREWAFRPGPALTYLKMLCSDPSTFKRAASAWASSISVGLLARRATKGRPNAPSGRTRLRDRRRRFSSSQQRFSQTGTWRLHE